MIVSRLLAMNIKSIAVIVYYELRMRDPSDDVSWDVIFFGPLIGTMKSLYRYLYDK